LLSPLQSRDQSSRTRERKLGSCSAARPIGGLTSISPAASLTRVALLSTSERILCAARLMELANTVARDLSGVATTGILSLRPGSINTIPGTVDLTLDIRHISDEKLDEMEARILDEAEGITKRLGTNGCSIEWKKTFQKAPVMFHDDCVGAITEAAERHLGEGGAQTIYSGAGHDR
jgi:acetylornithine deacetylase/succinyl-diaminopimelate desuccinylase-like protein